MVSVHVLHHGSSARFTCCVHYLDLNNIPRINTFANSKTANKPAATGYRSISARVSVGVNASTLRRLHRGFDASGNAEKILALSLKD
jgi:hypothetical protein